MMFMVKKCENDVPTYNDTTCNTDQVSWEDGQYDLFYSISWTQTKRSKNVPKQSQWRQKRSFLVQLQFSSAQAEH